VTWKAVEHGLELLKGVIWHVGNSANIQAWRDPWIPRTTDFQPISKQGRCRLKWVLDFPQADGTRNEQLLRRRFLPIDVADILKIKPSRGNAEDSVV
jgi:hypothetical protein